MDTTMAVGSRTGHKHQHDFCRQHRPQKSAWPWKTAGTLEINITHRLQQERRKIYIILESSKDQRQQHGLVWLHEVNYSTLWILFFETWLGIVREWREGRHTNTHKENQWSGRLSALWWRWTNVFIIYITVVGGVSLIGMSVGKQSQVVTSRKGKLSLLVFIRSGLIIHEHL